MAGAIVRAATADDVDGLADLRIRWADLPATPSLAHRQAFARHLAEWMDTRANDLVVRVAEVTGEIVGMAWMVVFERVPNIDEPVRKTADIQSVFVAPGHRRAGIGAAMVAALVEAADEMAIARVTVSANAVAAGLYTRAGFSADRHLLERHRFPSSRARR